MKLPGEPPLLTTESLRLVAPDRLHVPGLFAYGSRPDFTAHLDATPFRAESDAVRFIDWLCTENRQGKRLYWVAERRTDGRAVGTLGLIFHHALRHRVAEFGFGFSPDCWGTGLFAEAAHAILGYAGTVLGFHRIEYIARIDNRRAIRAGEKLGFRQEAVFAEFYQETDGSRSDAVLLALLRPGDSTP
jgi:[ribosomal protein S5]-alanine N-acetyltransferase